ncbi:MAG TPA: hypothetical protein VGX23_07620 [Actinocrinis sp.]|nr:hypothetical protein [Actinocrinis sp.]
MTSPSDTQPVPARVTEVFARFAQDIAAKEAIPTPTLLCRAAATEELPDGSPVTLWVAEHTKSRCYLVETVRPDGERRTVASFCGEPGDRVSLSRAGTIVIGSVGVYPAESVNVTTPHGEAILTVAAGYFLIPPHLSPETDVRHSVTLTGAAGNILGRVVNLPAPGRANPTS